jgi:phospholipase C
MAERTYSRRQLLAGGFGGVATLGMARTRGLRGGSDTIRRATQVAAAGSDLGAVKHVVFLMQENRSFDHYFGTMPGVAGYDDGRNRGSFTQTWPGGSQAVLLPFHMDTRTQQAECTYDLDHSWPAEHASWNGGGMDRFVATHTSAGYEGALGINTMGYYTRRDLPFYYRLAEEFTVCDNYFCSVLGPTHPNRLMQMTGTIDPAGEAGGPVLVTNNVQTTNVGTCSWTTMPEALQARGISWRAYNPYGFNYQPIAPFFFSKNMLSYFKQFQNPLSPLYHNAFGYYGPNVVGGLTGGVGPNDFAKDVANGTLPQVSWIMSPDTYDEHPPAPPALGEWYTQQVLDTLVSNPAVWASTVLFIMYDENDGFFDHVPPPTPPPRTHGEYLTVDPLPADAGGVAGPIGLGVRVPMMVVSPFSAGGHVCSEVFDHTSQLRFLETVFDVTAPNISRWRRSVTGDLTATLPVLHAPVTTVPHLPATSASTTAPPVGGECSTGQLLETNPTVPPFVVPRHQKIPNQAKGTLKRTPV